MNTVQEQARKRWDSIAKPLHSLGLLEDLVVRIAVTRGTPDVCIDRRCALVFCGDHGVVRKGVSQTDSSVTALVARSIAEGTGNITLFVAIHIYSPFLNVHHPWLTHGTRSH